LTSKDKSITPSKHSNLLHRHNYNTGRIRSA